MVLSPCDGCGALHHVRGKGREPRATATTGGVGSPRRDAAFHVPGTARGLAHGRVRCAARCGVGDFFRSGMVETPEAPGAPAAWVVHRWTRPWSTARRERRKKRYLI